jgi:fumarate reductase subunit D
MADDMDGAGRDDHAARTSVRRNLKRCRWCAVLAFVLVWLPAVMKSLGLFQYPGDDVVSLVLRGLITAAFILVVITSSLSIRRLERG